MAEIYWCQPTTTTATTSSLDHGPFDSSPPLYVRGRYLSHTHGLPDCLCLAWTTAADDSRGPPGAAAQCCTQKRGCGWSSAACLRSTLFLTPARLIKHQRLHQAPPRERRTRMVSRPALSAQGQRRRRRRESTTRGGRRRRRTTQPTNTLEPEWGVQRGGRRESKRKRWGKGGPMIAATARPRRKPIRRHRARPARLVRQRPGDQRSAAFRGRHRREIPKKRLIRETNPEGWRGGDRGTAAEKGEDASEAARGLPKAREMGALLLPFPCRSKIFTVRSCPGLVCRGSATALTLSSNEGIIVYMHLRCCCWGGPAL